MKKIITIACFLLFGYIVNAEPALKPANLICEYSENPSYIDISKPRLSWNFISPVRNQFQSADEIIVSDNATDTEKQKGNVWQTGKIISSQNLHIEYAGETLKPFTRYYWCVKVYDKNGDASAWSKPHLFETAMLVAGEWKAQGIGDGSKQFERDKDFYKHDPMPLLRKQFNATKKIVSARLYISGLGYYAAYLNDKKIGDHFLDPGFTFYKKQALYVTYDFTSMPGKGANTIGIMLGKGYAVFSVGSGDYDFEVGG